MIENNNSFAEKNDIFKKDKKIFPKHSFFNNNE